jgi:hypothetical protein
MHNRAKQKWGVLNHRRRQPNLIVVLKRIRRAYAWLNSGGFWVGAGLSVPAVI